MTAPVAAPERLYQAPDAAPVTAQPTAQPNSPQLAANSPAARPTTLPTTGSTWGPLAHGYIHSGASNPPRRLLTPADCRVNREFSADRETVQPTAQPNSPQQAANSPAETVQHIVQPTARLPSRTAVHFPRFCGECGAAFKESARFCSECGAKRGTAVIEQASPGAPIPPTAQPTVRPIAQPAVRPTTLPATGPTWGPLAHEYILRGQKSAAPGPAPSSPLTSTLSE